MAIRGGKRDGAGRPKAEKTVQIRVPESLVPFFRVLVAYYSKNGDISGAILDIATQIAERSHEIE